MNAKTLLALGTAGALFCGGANAALNEKHLVCLQDAADPAEASCVLYTDESAELVVSNFEPAYEPVFVTYYLVDSVTPEASGEVLYIPAGSWILWPTDSA